MLLFAPAIALRGRGYGKILRRAETAQCRSGGHRLPRRWLDRLSNRRSHVSDFRHAALGVQDHNPRHSRWLPVCVDICLGIRADAGRRRENAGRECRRFGDRATGKKLNYIIIAALVLRWATSSGNARFRLTHLRTGRIPSPSLSPPSKPANLTNPSKKRRRSAQSR